MIIVAGVPANAGYLLGVSEPSSERREYMRSMVEHGKNQLGHRTSEGQQMSVE